jgi:hypothetical protein
MATTHIFNSKSNPEKGGKWVGGYGELLCRWELDSKFEKMRVVIDSQCINVDLSEIDEPITAEYIKSVMPVMAIETLESKKEVKYEI